MSNEKERGPIVPAGWLRGEVSPEADAEACRALRELFDSGVFKRGSTVQQGGAPEKGVGLQQPARSVPATIDVFELGQP